MPSAAKLNVLAVGALMLAVVLAVAGCEDYWSSVENGGMTYSQRAGINKRKLKESNGNYYKIGTPYRINGRWYHPREDENYVEEGVASWYGPDFHLKATANGEEFDKYQMTAAHRTLPLPSIVRVTNLENGKSVLLRVNDRGPFVDDRIIDVSKMASKALGFYGKGLARVRVTYDKAASDALFHDSVKPVLQTASVDSGQKAFPASDPSSPHVSLPGSSPHFIQVAAFSSKENAKQLVDKLSAYGKVAINEEKERGMTLYKVVLGPFADHQQMLTAQHGIGGLGLNDAIVISSN